MLRTRITQVPCACGARGERAAWPLPVAQLSSDSVPERSKAWLQAPFHKGIFAGKKAFSVARSAFRSRDISTRDSASTGTVVSLVEPALLLLLEGRTYSVG